MSSDQPELSDPALFDAVVIGGGMAGLTAAHTFIGEGIRPVVLEATSRCGGYLASGDVGPAGTPVRVDIGAESFAARSAVVAELIRGLGLEIIQPSDRSAWGYVPAKHHHIPGGVASASRPIEHNGRAFPLPKTGVLGIPGHPWASDTRQAIGFRGALRASLDSILPKSRVDTSNLAALVRSRLGSRVLDRLVVPVAGGVHSTDPSLLSVEAVAPGLLEAYERTGSLTSAVRTLRALAPAGSAVNGIPGGMNQLIAALERAVEAGGEIRRSTLVESMKYDGTAWTVRTASGDVLRTTRVVLAATGHVALDLLADLVDVGGASPEPGTNIRLVTLLLTSGELSPAPRGTGILAAPGTEVVAKGSTHASSKWPWLRAYLDETLGDHAHVIRLSYGRRTPEGTVGLPFQKSPDTPADDAALVAQAVKDIRILYGIQLHMSDVEGSIVTYWDDALAPPTPEHRARVAQLAADVSNLAGAGTPGLALTGAWVAGTGLALVVPHAQNAAHSLLNS